MPAPNTLGIDFGTSNSAAGIAVNGTPWLVELESGVRTLPTAVFFGVRPTRTWIGSKAVNALIDGDEGRFMRALKSLLGTPLMREERLLGGERVDFIEVTARFLREVKGRAEAACHQEFSHALSGRPVRFHSKDARRDEQAELDLRDCYRAAGFQDVSFMYEPEAAVHSAAPEPGLGLIADIGGGTSDFTVFEQDSDGQTRILASEGVRIGGTDFDRLISIAHVMPLLGRGSAIRDAFGSGTLPAPARIFNDLATWQMIPFLYSAATRRSAQELLRQAAEPDKLARLVSVLEDELGHDLAFAAERGKIHANQPDHPGAKVDLRILEPGLSVPLSTAMLADDLSAPAEDIARCGAAALSKAQVTPQDVGRVLLVGGSSLLHPVQAALQQLCPQARLHSRNALTAVAEGLALKASDARC